MASELGLYIQNQPELVKKYNDQIITLHHGQVEGVFDTKLDALTAMKAKYASGDFMIIKCTPTNKEYTTYYRSPRIVRSTSHV